MKKSLTSIILALLLIATLSIPAMAADYESKTIRLIPIEEVDAGIHIEASNELLTGTDLPSEDVEDVQAGVQERATEIRTMVNIRRVVINPIVVCLETGGVYALEDIQRSTSWSGYSGTDESLKLTSSAISAFETETLNALKSNAGTSQYSWGICGWRVVTTHHMQSQYPLSVYWTPSRTCMDGTEKRSEDISAQAMNVTISENYSIPEDPFSYYYLGISGAYRYRIPSTGESTGTMFGGGVMMNY